MIIEFTKSVPFIGGVAATVAKLSSPSTLFLCGGLSRVILFPLQVCFSDPIPIGIFPVTASLPGIFRKVVSLDLIRVSSNPILYGSFGLIWVSVSPAVSGFYHLGVILVLVLLGANLASRAEAVFSITGSMKILNRKRQKLFARATLFGNHYRYYTSIRTFVQSAKRKTPVYVQEIFERWLMLKATKQWANENGRLLPT